MNQHDLIIIGAGPGGHVAAIRAAQLGLNVACVEQEAVLGGTCLRIGCIPSKALLESSEHYHRAAGKVLEEHGVKLTGVELDLPGMLERKDKLVDQLTKGVEALFKKNKVHRYIGRGRIVGPGRVDVSGADGDSELAAPHVLIATGSRSADLPGVELDYDRIGTSTEALSYPEVPGHLAVIGAGVIGLELGSVWRRLGAQVTVLEYLDRILPGTDGEIAKEAHKLLRRKGFKFHLGCRVTGARVVDEHCVVEREGAEPLECDRVLLAVGRIPYTEGLGLEAVGIELDSRGRIPVDDHFATSSAGVFAIGDVIRGPMLAHKAEEEGVACVEYIAGAGAHAVNYGAIPGVCYMDPEVAGVGQTEEQLREAGMEYRSGVFHIRANARARALSRIDGRVKVLADAQTDRILGVHIIGPQAGDLIAEAVLALEAGFTSARLARCSHAHPSLAEALKEAALAVSGPPIHA